MDSAPWNLLVPAAEVMWYEVTYDGMICGRKQSQQFLRNCCGIYLTGTEKILADIQSGYFLNTGDVLLLGQSVHCHEVSWDQMKDIS
jgi:hypothetical protein